MGSKSEKFWSFSHPSAPRNANALDGDKPTHSHAEVAIFFVVERCQSSKRISGSILREIETIHDTLIFCFDGGK